MKRKYYGLCGVLACVLMIGGQSPVFADDSAVGEESAPSTFQNQAQVQHAQNAADEFAETADLLGYFETRLAEEEDAAVRLELESIVAELHNNPDADIHAIAFDEVTRLREDGMGWGEIAHALGVHPSVLGLGHTKTKGVKTTDVELALATSMDMKTGNAVGHGKADDHGTGKDKSNNGSGGHSSGKDKGEKGNSGDKGHGNGNGKKQ